MDNSRSHRNNPEDQRDSATFASNRSKNLKSKPKQMLKVAKGFNE